MMPKFKVVIIDDEPLAIKVVEHYLNHFPNYTIEKTFTNSLEAATFLNTNSVDLVFTDVAMPLVSGIELIRLINNDVKFVLITSYNEYAVESFELEVIDYLLKPVSFDRFLKTINRFEKTINDKNLGLNISSPSFFIKEGDEFIKINITEIDYIEGMKDYAKIVCGKHYYLALKTLKSIETSLLGFEFLRVHKSYIVPLKKISQYNNINVLIGKHEIPVGSSYRNTLKEYFIKNKL